jgi:hypothetical protein
MIDLDELERIATAGDPWGYAATPKNILELVAEVRRLREDAERYQWLRRRDLDTIDMGGLFVGLVPDNLVINDIDLDQAIDAALAKEKL